MILRILSAIVMIPVVLVVVTYADRPYFLLALGLLGSACIHEYGILTRKMGLRTQLLFMQAGFWFLLLALNFQWCPATAAVAALVLAGFLLALGQRDSLRERILGMMGNLTGVFYLGSLLYSALALRFEFGKAVGLPWFLILLAVVWVGDTAALCVGKTMGRHLLSPAISPKKTNEGAIGGLLAGVLAAVLMQQVLFTQLPLLHVGISALLLGIFGQLGDLGESILKRAAGVKDSSHIIPGHGGVLDRVDSLLFAFPVLYFYLFYLYAS